MIVAERTPFPSSTNRTWVATVPFLLEMIQPCVTAFEEIGGANHGDCSSHDRYFGLSEPVNRLLHVPNDANGGIPVTLRSHRIVGLASTPAPQASQQAEMGRIGVLVLVDDEGPVLSTDLPQDQKSTMQILAERLLVAEQRQRPSNVGIAPRLIAEPVKHVDHLWRIEMSACVWATCEEHIRSITLQIVKVMQTVQ